MREDLHRALEAIGAGDKQTAYRLLVEVIKNDPQSKEAETAWLWMSRVLEDREKKRQCLETVLSMNPANHIALNELAKLESLPQSASAGYDRKLSHPSFSEYRPPDRETEDQSINRFPVKWVLAAAAILSVCLFVSMILIFYPIGRSSWSIGEIEKQPTSNPASSIKLPPTYTPKSNESLEQPAFSNNQAPIQNCKDEATAYIEQISPSLYSFAQVTDLAYEVTSDIGMIPIISELEGLRADFSTIRQPGCVQQDSRSITNGMDTVITAITDFTIGASDENSATAAVHIALETMLDAFERLSSISEQPFDDTKAPTLFPTQSRIQVLPPPATLPPVVILPTLTPVTRFSGSDAEFSSYLRNNFSTIGGQGLQIEDISITNDVGTYSHCSVSIELTNNSASGVFANQKASVAYDYGERLLDAINGYFGGQDCMVRVFELFYDDYLFDRYFDDDWYYIGHYNLDRGWAIQRDYVNGFVTGGRQRLEVWNE